MEEISEVPQLQLFISCRKLADVDRYSVSDPRVEVQTRGHNDQRFQQLGLTEVIWNNLNPDFAQAVMIDYHFEEQRYLKFNAYHVKDQAGNIQKAVLLGSAECSLHEIVGSQGQQLIRTLRLPNSTETRGHIIVRAEEVQRGKDKVKIQFVGSGIEDHGGWFHTFRPFFTISRALETGSFQVVYKSQEVNGRNPEWPSFETKVQVLCNNDYNRPLRLEVFDFHSSGKHISIGTVATSLSELTESGKKRFPLINAEKARKRGYQDSGALEMRTIEIRKEYDFLDYISGGCQISLIVGIDFTGSNGHPRYPSSLHYMNPNGFNDYEKALSSVGEILLHYDSDKLVPVYGFGGKINGRVEHCFPLTFTADPNAFKIEGLMSVYRQALPQVELSGPTLFAQVIQTAVMQAEQAAVTQSNQQYYVLLMITDGAIHDMQQTIDWIVRGSLAPLSIVIVGVGKDDFGNMDILDADEVPLIDSRGTRMDRDIVQFVPFRDCGNDQSRLTREVLDEIPREIVNFFLKKGIIPNPQLPRPEYNPLVRGHTFDMGAPSAQGSEPQMMPQASQGQAEGGYPYVIPQQYAQMMGNALVTNVLRPPGSAQAPSNQPGSMPNQPGQYGIAVGRSLLAGYFQPGSLPVGPRIGSAQPPASSYREDGPF